MAKQPPKEMFRKEALEHLSSPEQLDQLLQVVRRRSWMPILTLAGGLVAAIVWGVLGRIPVTVEGTGVLLYRGQVVPFQAPASGQIVSLDVSVGDRIKKNQDMGRINQPELEQQLAQERVRLEELKDRDQGIRALRHQRTDLEKGSIERNRATLNRRIASTRRLAKTQQERNEKYFAKQEENLARLREVTQQLEQVLRERYESFEELKRDGLSRGDLVLDAQRDWIDNGIRAADLELRGHGIELRRIEAQASYQQQRDLIADLESKLQELEIESSKINLLQAEIASDSALKIRETERNIARFEKQLATKGRVLSKHAGRVVEITAAVGQIVSEGQRLGSIEEEVSDSYLSAVGYFDVSSGKKIIEAMGARISPTTVQRERYGSMIGSVTGVSDYPVTTDAVTNVVGNAEVARRLTAGAGKIEVFLEMELDSSPTGFKWTSGRGPDGPITAGTTVVVRVTLEDRRPISYLIPLLKDWRGE